MNAFFDSTAAVATSILAWENDAKGLVLTSNPIGCLLECNPTPSVCTTMEYEQSPSLMMYIHHVYIYEGIYIMYERVHTSCIYGYIHLVYESTWITYKRMNTSCIWGYMYHVHESTYITHMEVHSLRIWGFICHASSLLLALPSYQRHRIDSIISLFCRI